MAFNKSSRVISPKPIFTNTNEIETVEDIHYNSQETTIYDTDDLDRASTCLDNLCIISHFCTLSSLDDYVSFLRDHLD
jgi:hypothetical protein